MLWRGMKNILQNNQDIIILLEVNSQRYSDSEAFYKEIADNGFILRAVDNENGIIEVERDYLMAKKGDSMLYLSRRKSLN
jgi:hypothetical protein